MKGRSLITLGSNVGKITKYRKVEGTVCSKISHLFLNQTRDLKTEKLHVFLDSPFYLEVFGL